MSKILYVCSSDLSGEIGSLGSVRHIMEVSENLYKLGNQVKLIVPYHARYPHKTAIDIIYIPILKVKIFRTLMAELLAPLFIIAYLLCWRPDVIYWRQAYLTIFPVLLARLFQKMIVTEVNGLTIDEIESEPLNKIRKKCILSFEAFNYHRSHHLICVAPKIRERIIDHYRLPPEKVSVILNGVNSDKMPIIDFWKAKEMIGIQPDSKVIGFVGHFFPWDGIETIIKAAPQILKEVRNTYFLIIGHGKWGVHLQRMASKKGVSEKFIFTGKVPWEKLYLYINAFDIATAPYAQAINTNSGRSSLKILEYFSCKKPVIASETDAIPEIVDIREKGFGVLVKAEDSDAFAREAIRLLKSPDERKKMAESGRSYVVNERSWTIVARKTETIINELVN
jgi:glycosyltransferase involved in cell wall biosynthesis